MALALADSWLRVLGQPLGLLMRFGLLAPSARERSTPRLPEHWSTGTLCKSLSDIDGN